MSKCEAYRNILEIIEQIPGVSVTEIRGGSFTFPIYMNQSLSETPIDALDLSVRASNSLKRAGINTLGDFCEKINRSSDLLPFRSCGKNTIAEIMDKPFAYQYKILPEEKRVKFLVKMVEMNQKSTSDLQMDFR